MNSELHKQALVEQIKRYRELETYTAELHEVLSGLVYKHENRKRIHNSWWVAAKRLTERQRIDKHDPTEI